MTADELQQRIQAAGLTYTEAADRLRITRVHLWRLLNEETTITQDRAILIDQRLPRKETA